MVAEVGPAVRAKSPLWARGSPPGAAIMERCCVDEAPCCWRRFSWSWRRALPKRARARRRVAAAAAPRRPSGHPTRWGPSNTARMSGSIPGENQQFQADGCDPQRSTVGDREANPAETGSVCDSVCSLAHTDRSPRAMLVKTLTETISAATAAGDLGAARVAHEALGKLLVEPEPGDAKVVDIRSQRGRKGGAS